MLNARSVLIVSVGINLLLAGWLVAKLSRRTDVSPTPAAQETATENAPAPTAPRLLRTHIVEISTNTVDAPGFQWSQIETNDFHAYAANLRAVGCPEHTLRDILVPDIEKAYKARERATRDTSAPFWENGNQTAARSRAQQRAQMALEAERHALLRELTGAGWSSQAREVWVEEEEAALTLGFLPDEKVLPVLGLIEDVERLGDTVRHETRGVLGDEDLTHIREVARSIQQQATAHLTPGEAQELALRGFDALQDDLYEDRRNRGVELGGVEYRELLRLASEGRDWIGDILVEALGGRLGDLDEIRRQRPENFEAGARALLGEQRFAAYQRSQDQAFHDALEAADRGKLPESVAIQAYDIRQAALAGARQLAAEATLTPEQHKAALDEMHRAAAEALTALYGPKEGEEYARRIQRAATKEARRVQP